MPWSSLFQLLLDIDIGMLEHTMIPCFATSKMVLIDEMNEKKKYDEIVFVEFLEFIAWVADYKFRDWQMTLYQKLLTILEKLFALIKEKVIIKSYEVEIDSESDNEFIN